jgi:AraC-like DNA-binding protein
MGIHAGERRDPLGVINSVATGVACGLDAARLYVAGGLDPRLFDQPDIPVLAWQELAVVEALLSGLPDQDPMRLGLETGLRYGVAGLGLFGWAMMTRATLADALTLWERLPILGVSYSTITAADGPAGELIFSLDDRVLLDLPPPVHHFLISRGNTSITRVLQDLIGAPVVPARAELRLPCPPMPEDEQAFRVVFGPDLTFGQDGNRLVYDGDLRAAPLRFANLSATRSAEQALLAAAVRRGAGGPVLALRVLLRDADHPPPDLPTAAARLALSERSLRRRLAEAGTSFRREREAALIERARRLMAAGKATIEDVAAELGYADAAAFTRAFRRWTGETPGRFARSQPRRSAMTASSTT